MNPITSVNQDNIVSDTQLTPTLIKCNETIKVEQFDKNNVISNNNISLIDPYWYHSEIKQVFGRAVRISSNHKLPEKKYPVKITILDQ